jgi:hypothetical protein
MPHTEQLLPTLANPRRDNDDPSVKKSRIERDDPRRLNPYTLRELPKRMKLRTEELDPKLE